MTLKTKAINKADSLEYLFHPRNIAVVGASDNESRIGGRPISYMLANGYEGDIYPINPKYEEIQGIRSYPTINDVPGEIDLAILAIPSQGIVDVLNQSADKGVKAVIIFSAGFAETGDIGKEMQDEIIAIAKRRNIRVLGPNCLGMFNTTNGLYATFSSNLTEGAPKKGRIGMVTQSGAVGSHVTTLAREMNIGVNYWISTGNESDIDVADCISYLSTKDDIDVIACYLEGAKDGEKLKNAFQLAKENKKPVVVLKTGRSDIGEEAVQSHTASLVGSDDVYEVIFDHYGVYRVETVDEFLQTAYACSMVDLPNGNNVGVFSVSGGIGILLADQIVEHSLQLPEPSQEIKDQLLEKLPFAGVRNPFDVTAQVINDPELLKVFMEVVMENKLIDSAIVFLAHFGLSKTLLNDQMETLQEMKENHPDIPLIIVTLTTPEVRKELTDKGLIVCEDPTQAVKILHSLNYFKEKYEEQPPQLASTNTYQIEVPSQDKVLTEYASKKLLREIGLPCTEEELAKTIDEAKDIAEEIGYPVVLKGMSPEVLHKTDSGLVHLNVKDESELEASFEEISKAMEDLGVEIEGVLVQEMVSMEGAEIIVGVKKDPIFGQILMIGMGGVFTEVFNDVSMRLAPVTPDEVNNMLEELQSNILFRGYRNQAELDIPALSQLVSEFSHFVDSNKDVISEIDLNPVIVRPKGQGVKLLDALIKFE